MSLCIILYLGVHFENKNVRMKSPGTVLTFFLFSFLMEGWFGFCRLCLTADVSKDLFRFHDFIIPSASSTVPCKLVQHSECSAGIPSLFALPGLTLIRVAEFAIALCYQLAPLKASWYKSSDLPIIVLKKQ